MIMKSLLKGLSASILLSATFFASADEFTITFDDTGMTHGTVLDNQYGVSGISTGLGIDVTFWAQTDWDDNANSLDSNNWNLYLALFNTDASNTRDSDLELGMGKGNVAIVQENTTNCSTGTCTSPDDRYSSTSVRDESDQHTIRGGFMFVQFSQPVSVHSIGLADIEGDDNQRGQFGFINSAGAFLGYNEMNVTGDISKSTGPGYLDQSTPSYSVGDTVSYIVIKLVGSGGINDISISKAVASVPEPASLAILSLGLLMMGRFRKA
jgi:hypothetical protein